MATVDEETTCPACQSNDINEGVEFIEDQLYGDRCYDCGHEWNFG